MISEPHTGNHSDFIQSFYPLRCNSNVLKLKTSWYLQRKINFKLLIKNQLGPARRAKISKMFGYLFFSALGPQPNISTLSTLVFLLLQKFEFALHVRYCCIIRALSSDFNPPFYLQLWRVCVHQRCKADTSLGEKSIGLSLLGAGDFILRGLITFKMCGMPSYGWALVTKIHFPKIDRSVLRKITITIVFLRCLWRQSARKKVSVEVRLIHAEQISLYNFIVLRKAIDTAEV